MLQAFHQGAHRTKDFVSLMAKGDFFVKVKNT